MLLEIFFLSIIDMTYIAKDDLFFIACIKALAPTNNDLDVLVLWIFTCLVENKKNYEKN